ncbi:Drug/metabolite transporter [Corchorus olitorius]|uniref:WAT1-related protein n=1 Tax=Corchorus olitorius TaxID=93759 RepID=A0A1R3IZH9_9ROSI|nr:Drug/metabolite transporter [Corchorus olitorius]
MATRFFYKEVLPCTAMFAVESSNVVINILYKLASSKGMNYYIFIAYCYVLATLVFLPLAFFFSRKTMVPPLKFPFIARICLLGLVGFSGLLCSYKGIEFGSATLASAISNLSPAFTFILAVFFSRLLPYLHDSSINIEIIYLTLCAAMVTVESTNVIQNILFKAASSNGLTYYIFIAYAYSLASITVLPLTFFLIRKAGLPPINFSLISKLCLLCLVGFSCQICVYKGLELGSPTLSSAVSNLIPAFTFILAVFFSVIGAVVLSVGLYAVLWGKSNEGNLITYYNDYSASNSSSSSCKAPLLPSHKDEDDEI